jgi:hypothetical protein
MGEAVVAALNQANTPHFAPNDRYPQSALSHSDRCKVRRSEDVMIVVVPRSSRLQL